MHTPNSPGGGFFGRLLHIDLTHGTCEPLRLDTEYTDDYIGGRGLGARYLADLLPEDTDPFSPRNPAILMAGPLTATEAYSCHKYEWVTMSPLTGTYLCSNCGGRLGVNLRTAGYDGLVIVGRAKEPQLLVITEQDVDLRSADTLWGKTVSATQSLLARQLGRNAAVGCIGPSAEPPRAVRFASFHDGQRTAGRGGLGAVLGTKYLKAIAVIPGSMEVPVHDAADLHDMLPDLARDISRDRITGDALPDVGSMIWMDALAMGGALPARNYQASFGYADIEGRLDSETYRTEFTQSPSDGGSVADASCHRCPLHSAKLCKPQAGNGQPGKGPEFQSAWALGINLGILDFRPLITCYGICNDMGVDAISLGGTIGFAMECCQRGLLSREHIARDYRGLSLDWGDCSAAIEMAKVICRREGWLGELLADGVRSASEKLPGSAEFALHVKGMEFPGYDPRVHWSTALAYATSCRGACHLKSWGIDSGDAEGATAVQGQARAIVDSENLRAAVDSALICTFASGAITEMWMGRLLGAVTGRDCAPTVLRSRGAAICDLERRLALRMGLHPDEDWLPERILRQPIVRDGVAGPPIGRDNLRAMLSEYYLLRGWSQEGLCC